jgi:hypothetical protein
MEAHSVKVVHTCASGEVDNEMGGLVRRNFVLDDSYKLHQLFGSPATDVKVLESTESGRSFRRENTRHKMTHTPCRYPPLLDDFALPWLAVRDPLHRSFGLNFDDHTSGIAQSYSYKLRQGIGIGHGCTEQSCPPLLWQVRYNTR